MTPAFTVICPAYNRSQALRPTLDSVLAQELGDLELLVVSDASTDDTDAVVRSYADPRVRLRRCQQRAGHPGEPRNHGLEHARGRWVAYVDHDDVWRPDHLATLARLLGDGAPIAATGCVRVDAGGSEIARTSRLEAIWHPEIQVVNALFEPSRVAHERGLVAPGAWQRSGAGLEDWALWLGLADRGARFATSARPTALLHTAGGTRTLALPMRYALTLGVVPGREEAQAALAFLRLAPVQAELRALHVAAMSRWYRELAERGDLVLPDGMDPADLDAAIEDGVGEATVEGLALRPRAGGVAVVRPLACSTREHAGRIERVTRARFAAKHVWLARVLRCARPATAVPA